LTGLNLNGLLIVIISKYRILSLNNLLNTLASIGTWYYDTICSNTSRIHHICITSTWSLSMNSLSAMSSNHETILNVSTIFTRVVVEAVCELSKEVCRSVSSPTFIGVLLNSTASCSFLFVSNFISLTTDDSYFAFSLPLR
jgi:hypothetical protein